MTARTERKSLRIALVAPGFSAGEDDWCIPVLRNLVRQLAREHEVTVYTLRYPHHRGSYEVFGARVRAFGGATQGGVQRLPLLLRAWRAIVRDGRRRPYSVVHGFWADEAGFVAAAAARRLGLPAVVSLMGGELVALPQLNYGAQLGRGGRWLTRLSLRLAHTVTAGSPLLQERAATYAGARGTRLLPLGVDTDLFHPGTEADGQRATTGAPRLLHVGSLAPVKDQTTLLRAFALIAEQIPGARLDVVGDGPLQPGLAQLARSLGLARLVTFHGAVEHHHLPPFYRRADLFLLSSRYESQNLAFLEAAACGLPTVGTEVGLLPALLPADCLAPPGDAPALAQAALRLLHDDARRKALARQLQQHVARELTIGGTVERLMGLYSATSYDPPTYSSIDSHKMEVIEMTVKQLEQHVKLLGWLHILSHAIFLVIGAFVFLMLAGLGLFASGEAEAAGVMIIIGLFVGGLMLVLALPGLLAGYGLLKRRSWGRLLALIVGVLNLFNFPLGTALGVYTLWVLMQSEAADYFSELKPSAQM